jgi:hypothetical protein
LDTHRGSVHPLYSGSSPPLVSHARFSAFPRRGGGVDPWRSWAWLVCFVQWMVEVGEMRRRHLTGLTMRCPLAYIRSRCHLAGRPSVIHLHTRRYLRRSCFSEAGHHRQLIHAVPYASLLHWVRRNPRLGRQYRERRRRFRGSLRHRGQRRESCTRKTGGADVLKK